LFFDLSLIKIQKTPHDPRGQFHRPCKVFAAIFTMIPRCARFRLFAEGINSIPSANRRSGKNKKPTRVIPEKIQKEKSWTPSDSRRGAPLPTSR